MAEKKKMTIQEIDWKNHEKRLERGFINRADERHYMRKAGKHKHNNRASTNGRRNQYAPATPKEALTSIVRKVRKLIQHH